MTRSAVASHPGNVRDSNQDLVVCDDESRFWVLADGMGGNSGGEIASKLACDRIAQELRDEVGIRRAILKAHDEIKDYGNSHPDVKGLGTTVTLVQDDAESECKFAWVGDSRIYLWRKGKLTPLSKDHSVVQKLLDSGIISETEARDHPQRNLVTSCLGVDFGNDKELEIGEGVHRWQRSDKLILCSDGLTDEVEEDIIKSELVGSADSSVQAERLLKAALNAGAKIIFPC